MKKYIITISLFICFATITTVISRSFRVNQVPNGSSSSCNTCHTSGGGTPLNNFGSLVHQRFLSASGAAGNVQWSPLLASLDADNDGVSNGQELQDPYGLWSSGEANPGSSSLVSAPGQSTSSAISTININFSNMNPHVGQTLYLRVFDRNDMKETGRTSVTVSEQFTVSLDAVIVGHNYYIDFFSDHNQNGLYDPPSTDHAWRLELNDAAGNDELNFSHNTNFTDIEWPYLFTLNFSGMTPHVGQLLEVRVEDNQTSEEVGRHRIEFIPSADFSISIPGLKYNREYKVELYADLNKNGLYDEPNTDHAWRIDFTNSNGDHSENFAHNTEFKDVSWKYLYNLNILGFVPHIGQDLFIRVVKTDNSEEIFREQFLIPASEFTIKIPQIEMDHDYEVEFFADHNENGMYDGHPTDHSWKLNFNSSTGNFVQNFTHNANFETIDWTDPTDIEIYNNEIPTQFALSQNYPNPFNPSTKIKFTVPEESTVKLAVFNSLGEEISLLTSSNFSQGIYEYGWNASQFTSGVYFIKISANGTNSGNVFNDVKKAVLIK